MVFLQDSCSIITGFVHEESSTAPHARFYPWFKHAVVFATNFRRMYRDVSVSQPASETYIAV